jgi:serine/threonine protein kinase/tetratricopeptide (TPR) repeat protein
MSDSLVSEACSVETLVGRVADEFLRRQEAGERPDVEEYVARLPQAADLLRKVLASLQLLQASLTGSGEPGALATGDGPAGILGDFRIVREVGRGGMGIVYEAEQISLGRRVALKVLPMAATMDPRQLQRFHNEARAAAGLHHTNIVPVYGVGCERGVHYYAMQFIEGRTLAELISRQRGEGLLHVPTMGEAEAAASATTVPPAAQSTSAAPRDAAYFRRVAEWGIQAAEALDCAHALGVVHRDVKPANLLVDAAGRLWVTDFGLAQIQNDARLTMSGDLVGTLRYMSPEQALAQRVVIDQRTDMYSLGATLYELLTLQPAFAGADRQELLRQIAFEEPRAPRRVNKAIPADLETIVLKALEKNPADRYATAKDLADDLRRWVEDQPIRARRPSLVQRLRKWSRRHRAAVAAAVVCLVVTLVALGATGGRLLSDRAARHREAEDKAKWVLEAAKPGLRDGNPKDPALTSARWLAQSQLAGGGLGPELQQRVQQLDKDVWMLQFLGQDSRNLAPHFRDYGIDVEALGPAEAAALIQASAIREHLVAGLDNWAHQLMSQEGEEPRQKRGLLLAVARLADPDPWRNRLRDMVVSGDISDLGPLARSAPVEELPAATLGLLARLADESPEPMSEPVLDALRTAQQRFPGDYEINRHLAYGLTRSPTVESQQEAIGYFRAALALRPDDELRRGLAVCLLKAGKPAEAEAIYRRLSDYLPLGDVLSDQGKLAEAEAAYRKIVERDPTSSQGWAKLRDAWLKQGKPAEALLAEEEAAYRKKAEGENNSDSHTNFGDWLYGHGKLEEAKTEYRKAIELDTPGLDFFSAHIGLGEVLSDQGRSTEAEAEFLEAIRRCQDLWYQHNQIGLALYRHGRYEEAESQFRDAIRLAPDDPEAHDSLGDTLACLGQWEEASVEFIKATESKTHIANAWPWYRRALLCLRDDNLDDYRKVCSDMLGHFGKSDVLGTSDITAWTCVLVPNSGAAPSRLVNLAQKASAKAPKDHWHVTVLGAALYRAGRFEDAIKPLTEATALNPDPYRSNRSYTWFFLALAHHRLGHADEARRWLEKGTHLMEEELKRPPEPNEEAVKRAGGTVPPTWNRKLTLRLLRREAEEQIQGPGTKPEK